MTENPFAYFHQYCIIGTLKENKFGQISILAIQALLYGALRSLANIRFVFWHFIADMTNVENNIKLRQLSITNDYSVYRQKKKKDED